MSERVNELPSPEADLLVACWRAIESDSVCSEVFRTFYKWDGRPDVVPDDVAIPRTKLPALRLDPISGAIDPMSLDWDYVETIAIEAVVWSPGVNVLDWFGLAASLRRPLMSRDSAETIFEPLSIGNVAIVDSGGIEQFTADRYMRGRVRIGARITQQRPA